MERAPSMVETLWVRRVRLTLHSWQLPSWPQEHLRRATAGALRYAIGTLYPDTMVEIAYNAGPKEPVLDPQTGRPSSKGAELEFDIRGGTYDERHRAQHVHATLLEGIMRQVLQMFIEHDARNRFQQAKAGYRRYNDTDEPEPHSSRILT